MTELSIDTKKRRLRVRLQLVGESEPIEIEISRYNLNGKGDQLQLTVEAATTSREWVSAALREFVVGREFSIPKPAGAFLKLLS